LRKISKHSNFAFLSCKEQVPELEPSCKYIHYTQAQRFVPGELNSIRLE
jgi:hypothetical protein